MCFKLTIVNTLSIFICLGARMDLSYSSHDIQYLKECRDRGYLAFLLEMTLCFTLSFFKHQVYRVLTTYFALVFTITLILYLVDRYVRKMPSYVLHSCTLVGGAPVSAIMINGFVRYKYNDTEYLRTNLQRSNYCVCLLIGSLLLLNVFLAVDTVNK